MMRALANALTFLLFTWLIAIALFGLIVPVPWGPR
jgi:hypothetical protein